MDRFILTDAQWAKMEPFCLGKASDPGRTGGDARLFLEAVLWITRTDSPWRDLPPSFGNNKIIADLTGRGAKIVVSQMPGRTAPLVIDADIYKWRHLIENFFCKLKEFKRIATRSDKTDTSFEAMIYLGGALINSR